jgi:hypothetical protein
MVPVLGQPPPGDFVAPLTLSLDKTGFVATELEFGTVTNPGSRR